MSDSVTGYDIIGIGYSCIDYITVVKRLPQLDEKMLVENLLIQGGGPAATAMVAAARLGARTALITSLADDELGGEIISGLEEEGVDLSLSPVRPEGSSAFAFAMIERGTGLRTIVGRPAKVRRISADEVDTEGVRNAKVILIDGSEPEAQAAAGRAARAAGVPVIFDAGNEKEGMEGLLKYTDVLIASRGFGRDVGGSNDTAEAASAFYERGGLSVAAVTAGAQGAYYVTGEGEFHQRAFRVEVVDTTGAGDATHGAYAYGMMRGWGVRECARFAAAAAAIKCTKLGGRTGLPRLHEVKEFLAGGPEEV